MTMCIQRPIGTLCNSYFVFSNLIYLVRVLLNNLPLLFMTFLVDAVIPNLIFTASGSDPGAPCSFPFIYGGNTYWWCTTDFSPEWPWCGTTENVDRDSSFTNCFLGL